MPKEVERIDLCLDLGVVLDPDLNCCMGGCDGAGRGHCRGSYSTVG